MSERAVLQSVRDLKVVGRRRLIASVRCAALDVCSEVDGFWMLRDGCPRSDRSSRWLIGDLIECGVALQCGRYLERLSSYIFDVFPVVLFVL